MIKEVLGLVILSSGIVLILLGVLLIKKSNVYINRLLAAGFSLMGISVFLDGIVILLNNKDYFLIFQYLLAFLLPLGAAALFLAGITLVKGKKFSHQRSVLLPILFLTLAPGLVITVLQTASVKTIVINAEQTILSSDYGIGSLLFSVSLFIFFFGSFPFFYLTYKDCLEITKKRMLFFTLGLLFMIGSSGLSKMVAVFTDSTLFDVIAVSIMGPSLLIGSLFISHGFLKEFERSRSE